MICASRRGTLRRRGGGASSICEHQWLDLCQLGSMLQAHLRGRQGGFRNASPQRSKSHQRAFSKHARCYKNRLSSPPAPWPQCKTASNINNLALVGVARVGSGCQRRTSTLRSCMLLFIRVGIRAGVRAWVCVGYTLVSCALGLERGGLAACMSDVCPLGRQQCVDFGFQMLGIKGGGA